MKWRSHSERHLLYKNRQPKGCRLRLFCWKMSSTVRGTDQANQPRLKKLLI